MWWQCHSSIITSLMRRFREASAENAALHLSSSSCRALEFSLCGSLSLWLLGMLTSPFFIRVAYLSDQFNHLEVKNDVSRTRCCKIQFTQYWRVNLVIILKISSNEYSVLDITMFHSLSNEKKLSLIDTILSKYIETRTYFQNLLSLNINEDFRFP